jgi:hypothetical protein
MLFSICATVPHLKMRLVEITGEAVFSAMQQEKPIHLGDSLFYGTTLNP